MSFTNILELNTNDKNIKVYLKEDKIVYEKKVANQIIDSLNICENTRCFNACTSSTYDVYISACTFDDEIKHIHIKKEDSKNVKIKNYDLKKIISAKNTNFDTDIDIQGNIHLVYMPLEDRKTLYYRKYDSSYSVWNLPIKIQLNKAVKGELSMVYENSDEIHIIGACRFNTMPNLINLQEIQEAPLNNEINKFQENAITVDLEAVKIDPLIRFEKELKIYLKNSKITSLLNLKNNKECSFHPFQEKIKKLECEVEFLKSKEAILLKYIENINNEYNTLNQKLEVFDDKKKFTISRIVNKMFRN